MKTLLWTCMLALTLSIGCQKDPNATADEPSAETSKPESYEGHGLTFKYPGNWSLSDETDSEGDQTVHTLTLESPGYAILLILVFEPANDAMSLEAFGEGFLQSIGAEVKSATGGLASSSGASSKGIQRELLGETREALELSYVISVMDESIPHTSHLYEATYPERSLIIMAQVADEDRKAAGPGFDLILDSLAVQ